MHKIGILSDTHGMLRAEVLDALKGCEVILHGGDINKQKILDDLGAIAPVHVVRGNNDSDELVHRTNSLDAKAKEWAEHIPESITENIFGIKVFMVHNKKFIPKNLDGVNLVIYGHSHKYEEKNVDGIQYLNPGSCGPRRFNQEITLAILYLQDDGSFSIEKVLIPHPEKKASMKAETKIPSDIGLMIPEIMKEIDSGKTVRQIAKKHKISEELSEQIVRMYLTHPGVDVDGILRRIGL